MMKLQHKSKRNKYILRALLQGQTGPVTCVAAHPLGAYVACGGEHFCLEVSFNVENLSEGEEGTKIWHLPSSKLLDSPTGAGERGITTAIIWITRPDDTDDGLAYGTEDGYLCIWKRSRNENEVC
jgi:hypothetical protein